MNHEKQKLAIDISEIDWVDVQMCKPHADVQYRTIVERLSEYNKEDIIRLLLGVIEAQNLVRDYPETDSPFKDMLQFKYID